MNIQCTVCGADLSNQTGSMVKKHVDSHKSKINVQEKIAELEKRIVALEEKQGKILTAIPPEAQAELNSMWKHFDRFFDNVFK